MKLRKAWPFAVGTLAAVAIGANLMLVWLATSDPSFGVEPDYYGKALAWDGRMQQVRQNEQLGWTVELTFARSAAADGTVELVAYLRDAQGQPLDGATLGVSTFHNARSSRVLEAHLTGRGHGEYAAAIPFVRPGMWEFRLEARRDDARFTYTELREVAWTR